MTKMAAVFTQSAGVMLYEEENTDAHNQIIIIQKLC